jgi:uncharacterized protein (DUF1015 family)
MSIPLNTRQWGFGQEKTVATDSIDFSQHHLDEDKVKHMATKSRDTMPTPIAAHVGERYVIQDGHHRVAAAIKRGNKTIRLKVY